jgi:hypothetical protein
VADIDVSIDPEKKFIVAMLADGTSLIENTWDQKGTGPRAAINGYNYKNSTRTFTKTISRADGRPPNRPSDYVILKINAAGTILWDGINKDTLKLDVPDDGKIEAKLVATKELAPLSIQRILIHRGVLPGSGHDHALEAQGHGAHDRQPEAPRPGAMTSRWPRSAARMKRSKPRRRRCSWG